MMFSFKILAILEAMVCCYNRHVFLLLTAFVVLRNSTAFLQSHDSAMTYLLPPNGRTANIILDSDPICMPSQQSQNQTLGSPITRVPRGSQIVLRYQENGHVTMPGVPAGKSSSGTIKIYGTSKSRPTDTMNAIYNVWNDAGDGGDRRGRLLGTFNFDDGECYGPTGSSIAVMRQSHFPADSGQGPNRWCRNVVRLPDDAKGLFTLYWVWDWPTSAQHDLPGGLTDRYSTCIDIAIE